MPAILGRRLASKREHSLGLPPRGLMREPAVIFIPVGLGAALVELSIARLPARAYEEVTESGVLFRAIETFCVSPHAADDSLAKVRKCYVVAGHQSPLHLSAIAFHARQYLHEG